MATRVHKIGSIYSRTNGLLKSGVIKTKPVWFDVYKAFPPINEPCFERPISDNKINEIFYPEDLIRAKIHKTLGDHLGVFDLSSDQYKSKSQTWLKNYYDFITIQGLSEEEAFKKLCESVKL